MPIHQPPDLNDHTFLPHYPESAQLPALVLNDGTGCNECAAE